MTDTNIPAPALTEDQYAAVKQFGLHVPPPLSVSVDLSLAVYAAKAAVAHINPDEWHPALTGAQVTVAPGEFRLLASDRYRVAEVCLPLREEEPAGDAAGSFLVTRELLDFLVLFGGDRVGKALFTADFVARTVTVDLERGKEDQAVSVSFALPTWKFPPVASFLDDAEAAESVVDPAGPLDVGRSLAGIETLMHPAESAKPTLRFVHVSKHGDASVGQLFVTTQFGRALIWRPVQPKPEEERRPLSPDQQAVEVTALIDEEHIDYTGAAERLIRSSLRYALIAFEGADLPSIEESEATSTNAENELLYAPYFRDVYAALHHSVLAHVLILLSESNQDRADALAAEVGDYIESGDAYPEWTYEWARDRGMEPDKLIAEAKSKHAAWLASPRKKRDGAADA